MIGRVYAWFNSTSPALGWASGWRSWLGHALLVIALAAVFGVNVAIFCYFFREVEQAVEKHVHGLPQVWEDNLLDIVVPMVLLAIAAVAFGLQ